MTQVASVRHAVRRLKLEAVAADLSGELLCVDAYMIDSKVMFTTARISKPRTRAKAKDPSHLWEQDAEAWKR